MGNIAAFDTGYDLKVNIPLITAVTTTFSSLAFRNNDACHSTTIPLNVPCGHTKVDLYAASPQYSGIVAYQRSQLVS